MSDLLIRGVFPESNIRFAACRAAGVCADAVARHQSDWLSGRLLGEALVCSVLLSTTLKHREKITLRWMYEGAVGTILSDMTESAEVRGFTQRKRLIPEVATLAQATGHSGRITAVTSTPSQRVRTGITESVFQDVPRDLAYFLSLSFQIETALAVGLIVPPAEPVAVVSALGLLLQPLPGCDLERFEQARQQVESPRFRCWLEQGEPSLPAVLEEIGLADSAQIYGEAEPAYVCQCSREKADTVLRLFDPDELRDLLERDGQVEVSCHFCANSYRFSAGELKAILRQSQAGNG